MTFALQLYASRQYLLVSMCYALRIHVDHYTHMHRWSGERYLKRVLEAGREAMGEAGQPYRIGTVKQVYGVVSVASVWYGKPFLAP